MSARAAARVQPQRLVRGALDIGFMGMLYPRSVKLLTIGPVLFWKLRAVHDTRNTGNSNDPVGLGEMTGTFMAWYFWRV